MIGAAAMQRLVALVERVPTSIIQLGFRISVGAVFFKSGMLKFNSWQMAVMLFQEEYKVPLLPPEVAASIATVFELGCPILLFLGLATRLATLPLLGMILVIQTFVYPDAWTDHLLWASVLAFLLARGAGRFSVDAVIAQRMGFRNGE